MFDNLRRAVTGAFVLALIVGAPGRAQAADRYRQLADHIVVDVLGSKSGDVVLITSSAQNMGLISDLMVALRKVGAWPITNMISDRANLAYFDEVAPKFDSESPAAALRLAGIITAQVNIDYEQDPKLFANVSPARLSAQTAAYTPVTTFFLAHSIPYVEVGNGLFPSKYTASQYAISTTQLSDAFWNGVNVDYTSMRDDAQAVEKRLGAGSTVHVTAANGTDITFGVRGSKIILSNGAIPPPGSRRPGVAAYCGLPTGEVIFGPIQGTANGWVRFDPVFINNTEVDGMAMHFVNGKMTSMTATSGMPTVQAFYDAGTAGKDQFTFADFGVNRSVKFVPNSKMFASMAAGMVTLGTGGDLFLGGTNASTFNFSSYISNANVTIDGTPLIVKGRLVSLLAH
jgi:aminopeptidase